MQRITISTDADTTVLYFARHGETEYNRKGIVQGSGIDSILNDTGRRQADLLGQRFAADPVDALYSSTLTRARQTAEIVASHLSGVARRELDDLNEMSWGRMEGAPPSDERNRKLEHIKAKWSDGHYGHAVPGGESILDVQSRAIRAARQIVNTAPGQTVLTITHGRFLRVLLSSICDGYDLSHMASLGHDNTCVNRIVFNGDLFTADILNCTAHLQPVS
ncbi:histidine phosphatase family protein [Longibacter sp.]|jgi:probable phosphoglycerate mutase|uniref:histidine phosphatase family protein n=1 Tax=Longibacter sp. TaxID=2045415 RepID=UPI003EB78F12